LPSSNSATLIRIELTDFSMGNSRPLYTRSVIVSMHVSDCVFPSRVNMADNTRAGLHKAKFSNREGRPERYGFTKPRQCHNSRALRW